MKGFIEINEISASASYVSQQLARFPRSINVTSISYVAPWSDKSAIIYLNNTSLVQNENGMSSSFICKEDYLTVVELIEKSFM